MPVPPFESEYRSNSSSKLKVQNVTIVESGTSVVPRQRPKGIALGLPPSPSPRNTSSPQPQMFGSELFQATLNTEQKLSNSFIDDSQGGLYILNIYLSQNKKILNNCLGKNIKCGHRRNVSDTIALNR